MNKNAYLPTALVAALALGGCATNPGATMGADVYSANQVNTQQSAKVIKILAVLPAKVVVSNKQAQKESSAFGAIVGAIAGAALGNNVANHSNGGGAIGAVVGGLAGSAAGKLTPGKTLVQGVSLAYVNQAGKTLNSVEVGKPCQFHPGKAIMIQTGPGVTRIQPNATCPSPKSQG